MERRAQQSVSSDSDQDDEVENNDRLTVFCSLMFKTTEIALAFSFKCVFRPLILCSNFCLAPSAK